MLSYICDGLSENLEFIHIIATSVICYITFYLLRVVHKPELVTCNDELRSLLTSNISILQDHYWPSLWAFTNHFQTVIRHLFHKSIHSVKYDRVVLNTEDKGEVNLYFVHNDQCDVYSTDNKPTVIVIPGITGHNKENYVLNVIAECQSMGFRTAVLVNRGLGEGALKTPKTYCACSTDDLNLIVNHIIENYPNSPILFYAVSLGGTILTHYLLKAGKNLHENIVGALAVSTPWCAFGTSNSLEKPINRLLYNRTIVNQLKNIIKKNIKVFEDDKGKLYDLNKVLKASTIREFDDAFTSKIFGFASYHEYFTEASLTNKPLERISIPMLFLNSKDDPFAPYSTIPIDLIKKYGHNIAVILTEYGGHIGFLKGLTWKQCTVIEQLFFDYFTSLMEKKEGST